MSEFSSIKNVVNLLGKLFSFKTTPPPPVPLPLILTGVPNRDGISAQRVASNIIARKAEAGLPVGVLPNGEPNNDELLERIRAEEYFKEFLQNAKITIAIPPGSTIIANGASPSGPVTVVGATTTIHIGYGIIQ
jgi:hypothetical protein